jgi:dGTPase
MEWEKLLLSERKGSVGQEDKLIRTTFEQDFDRIIFSQPFRKLQDKTQVFPLPEDDFVHTRLTHSLEVSSVGRSLGKKAGDVVLSRRKSLARAGFTAHDFGAIVASAALAHDVGNPPFGHSGEQAISEFYKSGKGQLFQDEVTRNEWEDLTNFEGNAQGFRILNANSMKLTGPVLGAFSKYPRESLIESMDLSKRSQKKYGFFQSEKEIFTGIADELGLIPGCTKSLLWCRHPLAFLVEAADDICYNIIDLEDGCTLGLVSEEETSTLLIEILGDNFKKSKYKKISTRQERIGTLRAMTINQLINQVNDVFLDNEEGIMSGTFDQSLTDSIESKSVLESIIDLSIKKLYRSKPVLQIEAAGFEVLDGLIDAFSKAMIGILHHTSGSQKDKTLWRLIPEVHKTGLSEKSTTYEIHRNCIDFIAGMTDSFAISTYRKIKGISLPGF